MQQIMKCIICMSALGAFTAASPLPDGGDSTHVEGDLKGATLEHMVSCPAGWTRGFDKSRAPYCFNCGLLDSSILGCNPGCLNGSCSAYASTVCQPFGGHMPGTRKTLDACSKVANDTVIFPTMADSQEPSSHRPSECYAGGKKGEVIGSAYVSPYANSVKGTDVSDMCGFLLNNCPTGLHDQAVIYYMGNGQEIYDSSRGDQVQNNNFGQYASAALKLTTGGTC